MLKIDKDNRSLETLAKVTLPESGITERYDLQKMICNSSDAFFQEMSEDIMLLGEEVRPSDSVEDRIDLLAIDREGGMVVIELKRGNHKLHLLQALSYVSMISDWQTEDVVMQYENYSRVEEPEESIEQFLNEDIDSINSSQRIILIAEDFDYQVLVTAEWLTNYYGLDIKCYRLNISLEENGNEYLSCTCIFPPPEISQHVTKRGRKRASASVQPGNWDDILASIDNDAMEDFLRHELADGINNNAKHKELYHKINGTRQFFMGARKNRLYVWQYNRFENDMEYWLEKLGDHIDVCEMDGGKSLRFYVSKAEDFVSFKAAIENELPELDAYK